VVIFKGQNQRQKTGLAIAKEMSSKNNKNPSGKKRSLFGIFFMGKTGFLAILEKHSSIPP
jgi:hypothetical protein